MCGRYVSKEEASWRSCFRLTRHNPLSHFKSYNVAPTELAPVVIEVAGRRTLQRMRWGLVPHWAKDLKIGNSLINAQAQTIVNHPAFGVAFKVRRCLVPASGYYEWQPHPRGKVPHYITSPQGSPLGLAGLWGHWTNKETSEVLFTFTIVTTDANRAAMLIHSQMPVILAPKDYDAWLIGSVGDAESLLRPYAGELSIYPVSRAVNNPHNNHPGLISPLIPDDPPPKNVRPIK